MSHKHKIARVIFTDESVEELEQRLRRNILKDNEISKMVSEIKFAVFQVGELLAYGYVTDLLPWVTEDSRYTWLEYVKQLSIPTGNVNLTLAKV